MVVGGNQKYGTAQVQVFEFKVLLWPGPNLTLTFLTLTWPSPDPHLTFTWPGPGPELDNFLVSSRCKYCSGVRGKLHNHNAKRPSCQPTDPHVFRAEVFQFQHLHRLRHSWGIRVIIHDKCRTELSVNYVKSMICNYATNFLFGINTTSEWKNTWKYFWNFLNLGRTTRHGAGLEGPHHEAGGCS